WRSDVCSSDLGCRREWSPWALEAISAGRYSRLPHQHSRAAKCSSFSHGIRVPPEVPGKPRGGFCLCDPPPARLFSASALGGQQRRQRYGQLLRLPRRADRAVLAAVRAQQGRVGAVSDGVVLLARVAGNEGHADPPGRGLDVLRLAGQAAKTGVEGAQVLLEL